MGLQNTAHYLKSKGRNGDTELVHMSPREVNGLQALAKANGTSLTMNPNTGLPEAFRLEQLLPMAAGAALTATGVGAPLAALMVGGAYGAATGSIEKGLMAGIGAYGGAGITEGLATAGAESVNQAAIQSGTQVAPSAEIINASTVNPQAQSFQEVAGNQLIPTEQGNFLLEGGSAQKSVNIGPNIPEQFAPGTPSTFVSSPPPSSTLTNIGRGVENIFTKEGATAAYKGMPMGTLPATATSLLMAGQQTPSTPGYQEDAYDRRLKGYRLSPNYQPYQAPTPNPYYRPTYAAEGGVMNSFDDSSGMDEPAGLAQGNLQKGLFGLGYAGGGLSLGGYSDGGRMLKGPGDGMSDSIPGVIGGKQPARLADGEFVVPADVVSHLGNGSTDAGAKRLYSMMDKIRQARTGKKKQAPQVNVDKYLPTGKASGGIAGYASGGAIGYAEGGDINPTIAKVYQEQFGRAADPEGAKYWSDQLAQGKTVAEVSKAIAQAKEGQDMDIQAAASAYRQVLGRNPEPEGLQYWLSTAQSRGLTSEQLKNEIANAAVAEQTQRGITKPFTDPLQLASLEANPYAGYYSEKDIYDVAPDAENVSMIDGRRVQFTTPVTRQGVVSQYKDGVYTPTTGKDILNEPQVQAAINAARANGTFNDADYATLTTSLDAAKTAAEVRAALSRPQGQVVIDALQGQQIGEAKTLADAQAEAALRQPILTAQMAQNPEYYQSNRVLSDAYKAAGLTVPFDYSTYKGVDTRDRTSNLFTPENFQQKQNELVNTLNRSNPYRTTYQPINRGIANMPDSVQDPYSDAGLKVLYGQMMNQYAPAPPGQMNPATFTPANPFTYAPAPQNNLVLKNPITDAVTAEANQAKADAIAAANAVDYGSAGGGDGDGGGGAGSAERAGGLLSIDRKKRAKYKK